MDQQVTWDWDIRTARTSITPSGYFGKSKNNIIELEDFVTEEECDFLLNFIKNNEIWDVTTSANNENGNIIYDANAWTDRVVTTPSLEKCDPKITETLDNIYARLKPIIEKHFNVECYPTGPCLVRWPVGSMQWPHADKELHEGPDAFTPGNFPWYDLGTVIYFNDDYEGGRLHFPQHDIAFKPKRRAAYFFVGDANYIHGVDVITKGTRYTSPLFWTITKLEANK
jgi:hypothetical protein